MALTDDSKKAWTKIVKKNDDAVTAAGTGGTVDATIASEVTRDKTLVNTYRKFLYGEHIGRFL